MTFMATTLVEVDEVGRTYLSKKSVFINPDAVIAVESGYGRDEECFVHMNTGEVFHVNKTAVNFIRMINFADQSKKVKVDIDPEVFAKVVTPVAYRSRRRSRYPADRDATGDFDTFADD